MFFLILFKNKIYYCYSVQKLNVFFVDIKNMYENNYKIFIFFTNDSAN